MKVCSLLPPTHPRALARIRAEQEALERKEERRIERLNNPRKVILAFNHSVRDLVFASAHGGACEHGQELVFAALGHGHAASQ